MKHIWDAIELCQRKLINERERLTATTVTEPLAGDVARTGTATVDRVKEMLDEIDAELRAVTKARQDFKDQHGDAL